MNVTSVPYPTRALVQDPEPDQDVGDALVKVTAAPGADRNAVQKRLETAGATGVIVVGAPTPTKARGSSTDPLEQVRAVIQEHDDEAVAARALEMLDEIVTR